MCTSFLHFSFLQNFTDAFSIFPIRMMHSRQKLSGFEGFISHQATMLVSSVWLPLSRFLFIAFMRTLLIFLLFGPIISHSCFMSPPLLDSPNSSHTFCNFAENREILIHGRARYLRHTVCIYPTRKKKDEEINCTCPRSENSSIKFHTFSIFTLHNLIFN